MAEKSRSNTIPLLALFVGILCLYFPVTTTATAAKSDTGVDLFYLTLVWPGTLCYPEKCCMPTTDEPAYNFLIEDMKTYDSRTQEFVKNCKPSCRFSINKMHDLVADLYLYWSNLSCPCNNGYDNWKRSWCTNGQCNPLNETTDQHDYFQAALNMTARAKLLKVFQANNIEPASTTSYKLRDIETALMASLGLSTQVECVKKRVGPWEATLLSKINLCISKDGKHFVDCPFSISATCNTELFFPPFTRDRLKECDYDAAGSGGFIEMATEKHLAM